MKLINKTENSKTVVILILALILLCGIIVGSVAAAYITSETASDLTNSVLSDFVRNKQTVFQSFLSVFKYPVFVFLLSFSVLGILAIPITVFIKGFSLGFSIGSVIKILGMRGIYFSLATFGINLLLLIPCLLIGASISLSVSCAQIGFFSKERRVMTGSILPRGFFVTYGAILIILAILFTLEIFITPLIFKLL